MECVTTASMSILVNGSPTAPFHLQRGLRQGDPLSPFLFLLVAEFFNRLVIRGKELDIFKGITIGANQISITHLQFADDTIIFAPANTKTLLNYKMFLRCFALMSGLKVNYKKSALIPMNCEQSWVGQVASLWKCGVSSLPFTYLGIPLGANPRKINTWKPIIEKVEKRLALWKARNISRAGRLVLIKAILNNLPMYNLSLFRMPKTVVGRIIQLQRRFFWGMKEGEIGGHLIAWNTIQKPRDQGGLSVGDISIRNAALLFKWWWRLEDDQKQLWKDDIKSNHEFKYLGVFQERKKQSKTSI